MVVVAVAGGTGDMGQTVVDVIKKNPKHKVIVLSRKAPETQDPQAPIIATDYSDVDSLKEILESNAVHTVISCLLTLDPTAAAAEINLAKAADQVPATRRFILSDWSVPVFNVDDYIPIARHRGLMRQFLASETPTLEWASVHCGFFTDYFGVPHIQSAVKPLAIHIDMAGRAAAIPATGDEILSFTYTRDIARYVEAALDLPAWPEGNRLYCYGEHATYNRILAWAEDARGCRFDVAHDDEARLRAGQVAPLPSRALADDRFPAEAMQAAIAKFGLQIIKGLFRMPQEGSLNEMFPDIKPSLTVKQAIDSWRGK